MSSLRKEIGQRIKAARRAAGHKSARTFAQALGISESSVANAEIGSTRVGEGVYMDIESGLGWPTGSIQHALENEDLSGLRADQPQRATLYRRVVNEADEFERQVIALDDIPLETRWETIFAHRERWSDPGEQRKAR